MRGFLREYYALVISLFVLYALYFLLLAVSYYNNSGHNVYSLDDAYIHMAMAKNLAIHGVWGVTQYDFTSSSSSILWTLLLGGIYFLFGIYDNIPMILNLIFASLVIVSSFLIFRKLVIKPPESLIILLTLVLFTPLVPLMFTGLEHVMHIWVSLLFIYFVSAELSGEDKSSRNFLWLLVVSFMLPSIRYEGIFLAGIASILLLMQKKFLKSFLVFGCAFLPIFVFGLISVNNGWSFFPNSLLLKGSFPDITTLSEFFTFIEHLVIILLPVKYVVALVIGLLIYGIVYFKYGIYLKKYFKYRISFMVLMFVFNLILYAAYSKSGWSYRYQSFLVGLGIIIFGFILFKYVLPDMHKHLFFKWIYIVLIVFAPSVYFGISAADLTLKTPTASTNIYEQQYQMGQFLSKYYNGKSVALNDIGTSNYFADIKCVDLWGLSNLEISKMRRQGSFDVNNILDICRKHSTDIAIVYDSWFAEGDSTTLPSEWLKTGEWRISNNVIAGDSIVAFYALDELKQADLLKNMKLFESQLPETVGRSYLK